MGQCQKIHLSRTDDKLGRSGQKEQLNPQGSCDRRYNRRPIERHFWAKSQHPDQTDGHLVIGVL